MDERVSDPGDRATAAASAAAGGYAADMQTRRG